MTYSAMILSAALIYLAAVVSPGPNFILVARLSLARSRRAGFGATFGIALGSAFYSTLTLFGLSIIIAEFAWVGLFCRIAGGLYLAWLGIRLWRSAGTVDVPVGTPGRASAGDFRAGLRSGLITTLINPKSIAFFLGLFAAIVTADTPLWVKLTLIATGFSMEILWYSGVTGLMSLDRFRAPYQRAQRSIDRLFGAMFVAMGARIALSR